MARGTRSRHEVEGSSEVQDEISRRQLAGVRACTRAARRRDAVAFCRQEGRVATCAVRSTRSAEEVLDLAIKTALTLRLVFRLPLRQAEGFLRSVLSMMDVPLEAPDHTTLSRRSRHLTSSCAASRPSGRSISSSIARASLLGAKVNGPRRSTTVAASEAGRSSISASTGPV
jgi:Transposase DDE domain